jgi:thiol:disulfide interchange protein DsbC
MFRSVLFVFVAIAAGSVSAQEDVTQAATETLHKLVPTAKIQSVKQAPLAGFYAAIVDGHAVYVSADGKYIIEGQVIDVEARRDVMEDTLIGVRKAMFDGISREKRLTFAPPHPKYHVTVFTDIDCPYCRQFHKQIAEYNQLGIAVDYLLFPLPIHKGADAKAVTVWCSKDRNSSFTEAMNGGNIPPKTCDNPVNDIVSLADSAGVTGTPAIFAEDGTQLGGYLPPAQLASRLESLANPKSTAAK